MPQLELARAQEFVGHLEAVDSYRVCLLDSKGNLFLRTLNDVVQKLSVDGSASYEIDFRDHVEIPLGIRDIAVGPDDVLYVFGVDLARTGTAIYRVSPAENRPVLVRQIPALEPCRCAVATDLSLHMASFETGSINEFLLGRFNPEIDERFDRTTKSMLDFSIRRFSRDGRNASGYAPVRLPLDKNQLHHAIDLWDNFFAADRDGSTSLARRSTGACTCYSSNGIPVGKSRLELDGSQEGTPAILPDGFTQRELLCLQGRVYRFGFLIKSSDLIVAKHQQASSEIELTEACCPISSTVTHNQDQSYSTRSKETDLTGPTKYFGFAQGVDVRFAILNR